MQIIWGKIWRHKLLTINSFFSVLFLLYRLLIFDSWLASAFSFIPWLLVILSVFFLWVFLFHKYRHGEYRKKLVLFFNLISILIIFSYSGINTYAIYNLFEFNREVGLSVFSHNSQFWEPTQTSTEYIEFLKNQESDLYLIQEFTNYGDASNVEFNEREEIEKIESVFPEHTVTFDEEYLTISKYPIIQSYSGGVLITTFLRTDIEINGKILSLYNVHIPVHFNIDVLLEQSYGEFLSDIKWRNSWRDEEIQNLVSDIESNENSIIVSGDFNTARNMNSLDTFSLENIEKYSKYFLIGTWHSNLALWTLDYTFVDENIKINKHTYINPGNYSDHSAQKFWFEFK